MFSFPKRPWRLWDIPRLVFIQGSEREVNHSPASSALLRITGAEPQLPPCAFNCGYGKLDFHL